MKLRLFLLIGFSGICLSLNAQVEADDMPKDSLAAGNTESETPTSDSIYMKVEIEASWRGGTSSFIQFVQKNFVYPSRCSEEGINGYVLLRFIVDSKGQVSNFQVLKSTEQCPEFAEEAIRVMKLSPLWIPAMYDGRMVASYRQVPIRLSVSNE